MVFFNCRLDAAYLDTHLLGIPYSHFCAARLSVVSGQQHIRIVHKISVPGEHTGFRILVFCSRDDARLVKQYVMPLLILRCPLRRLLVER